jgi:hypothetical protein
MNAGTATIDWLRDEQLRVDDAWSVRNANGFAWWANRHAQHVEVVGSEHGPDGDNGYFLRVKTDLLRDLTWSEKAAAGIGLLMSTATMSGPIYDFDTGVLSLSSLVRVHEGIRGWMSPLLSVSAMLQIVDADFFGPRMTQLMGGKSAESGHPTNGLRKEPDQLALEFPSLMIAAGERQSAWCAEEFQQAVDQYMQQPPALLATGGGDGLTIEFPYGRSSSLCQMKGDQAHPRIGNGLFLLQSFPVQSTSDVAGTKLALELNAVELAAEPSGYGFGSYCYRDNCIHFTGFIPNLAYRAGLLPNIYFSCAGRAYSMAKRLHGDDAASVGHKPFFSAIERLIERMRRK